MAATSGVSRPPPRQPDVPVVASIVVTRLPQARSVGQGLVCPTGCSLDQGPNRPLQPATWAIPFPGWPPESYGEPPAGPDAPSGHAPRPWRLPPNPATQPTVNPPLTHPRPRTHCLPQLEKDLSKDLLFEPDLGIPIHPWNIER